MLALMNRNRAWRPATTDPISRPAQVVFNWLADGLAEMQRILARFPGSDWPDNRNYRYLRAKMRVFTRLRRELRSCVSPESADLVPVIDRFAIAPHELRVEADEVASLVRQKVGWVLRLLKAYLATGGPLPDPAWTM